MYQVWSKSIEGVMLQTRDAVEVVGEETNVSASVLIMNRVVLVMTVSWTYRI